jgi:hypothetical protein
MYPAAIAWSAVMFSNLARTGASSGGWSIIIAGGGPGCAKAAAGINAVAASATISVRYNLRTSNFIYIPS